MTAIADESGYGRYELLAKIAEGRRGPVFVARIRGEANAEPRYAVELNAFATGEEEPMRAFHQDVSRAAQIRHKNVLGIVELGASGTGYYVVTDYIDGATLWQIQERHRAMRPPRLVMAIMIDALHGLQQAHALRPDGLAQPLIHGSVSPDQLALGLDGICRITGFGNARPRVQTKPSHRSRSEIGYMAPEQLTGGEIDHRSDLFSIGVVMWNALTGKKLFHDRVEHLTMSNVLERKVPRPSSIGLSPPPAFDAVVLKALERDPDRRFQDAGELASALRDLARGAGCLAEASEVSEWVTTTFGRDLAARRLAISEAAHRPRRPTSEVSVLTGIIPASTAEPTNRDELSFDELARATDPPPRATSRSEPPTITHPALVPAAVGDWSPRKQLAVVGLAAFTVVALVIGWRWSTASAAASVAEPAAAPASHPEQIALEVTVLDVHNVALPAPPSAPAPAPARALPAAVIAPPARPLAPAPAAVPASPIPTAAIAAPNRVPVRPRRVVHPASPARPPVAEERPDPVAPRTPEPAPPEQPKPTLEANPYVYK